MKLLERKGDYMYWFGFRTYKHMDALTPDEEESRFPYVLGVYAGVAALLTIILHFL